mmetsp:Transcript_76492/g.222166  ORF Transcript_76492/g.222166 Transcript_76492/m.222166 type:complete len:244 (-) Transcript_76492:1059-1790(-)
MLELMREEVGQRSGVFGRGLHWVDHAARPPRVLDRLATLQLVDRLHDLVMRRPAPGSPRVEAQGGDAAEHEDRRNYGVAHDQQGLDAVVLLDSARLQSVVADEGDAAVDEILAALRVGTPPRPEGLVLVICMAERITHPVSAACWGEPLLHWARILQVCHAEERQALARDKHELGHKVQGHVVARFAAKPTCKQLVVVHNVRQQGVDQERPSIDCAEYDQQEEGLVSPDTIPAVEAEGRKAQA